MELATQTKTFKISWMGQYRYDNGNYVGGGTPIRVGGSQNYHSFIGLPTSVRDALKTSKVTPTMKFKMRVTNGTPEWDFGGHKETYNKATNGRPWYKYLRGFQTGYTGTGWLTFDMTSWFMNAYRDGTYHGFVLYSGASSTYYGEAYGFTKDSNCAYIEITGDWNSPPNRPTITYPVGGEIVDKSITLKWTSGGDPDGNPLKYQIAYKEGDGSGWYYVETGYGVTQYTFNTSNWKEGSSAQFAVRASDGQEWSPYHYGNKFTISHNKPPSKPTQLSPTNGEVVNRQEVIRFSWKHNDDGAQAGYRLAWRTVDNNGNVGSWNYIPSASSFANTTNQYYNMPANTLPNSTIDWTVQTVDQQGLQSEYANYVRFQAKEPTNAPTILAPTHLSTISTTRVTVEWSSLNQLEYELILMDTNGLELFSETKASPVKLREIPVDLENNKWYEIHLRVRDSVNLIWSDYTVVAFGVAFNPPFPPVIKKFEEAGQGVLNVFYSAGEGNILPDLLNSDGERWEALQPYATTWSTIEVLSRDSVKLNATQQSGVQVYLTENDIPLVEGATYTIKSTVDQQGGRLFIGALDEAGATIALTATPNELANTSIGEISISMVLPAGTKQLRLIWYTTADYTQGGITHSNMSLQAMIPDSATTSIELFRREYTPTETDPWVKIAEGLPLFGSFLDYTPASGVEYEYKVRAVNDGNKTSTDSAVKNVSIEFTETFLQEASNLSSIILLQYATSREAEISIDSALLKFAGRRDPVREFGEAEELTVTVEWEVDSYVDVRFMRDMLRRRDILLYRDGHGRRYWVTADELKAQDKPVRGFILSTNLTVTSYTEDLDTKSEEELI